MIEVRNLSKYYNSKKAVDNVSIAIPKGKITSFIGPNGAGKSTVLSMMTRLLSKDYGEIFIDGKEIGEWKSDELAKVLAILKQSNQVNLRLKVRELVAFGRFPHSKGRVNKEDRQIIQQAMDYLELSEIQEQYLDELSGGQRQRAFIAMVLAQNTDYIFLDEPLNNLDMKHSVQIMKILRKITDDLGKTVILVLHDINFASVYSDEIVAFKNGKLIIKGSAKEIIEANALKNIYDMSFEIQEIDEKKICIYF